MKSKDRYHILILNENRVPPKYTTQSIVAKELRLRTAQDSISQVHLLSPIGESVNPYSDSTIDPKVSIHRCISAPYYTRALPLFVQGAMMLRKLRIDWIEAESPIISGLAGVWLKKLFHLPLVIEIRASYLELMKHKVKCIPLKLKQIIYAHLIKLVYAHADLIICNSNFYYAQLPPSAKKKAVVINPGILPPKIQTRQLSAPFIIGVMCRHEPEKGISILIQALEILLTDQKDFPISLQIAGKGSQTKHLKQIATQSIANNHIQFIGVVPNYRTLITWDLLINPNQVNHPLEMVNIEAAAVGTPVVTFGIKGNPETVIHQQTGIIIPLPDPTQLSSAILSLLTHPERWKTYSSNAIKHSQKYHQSIQSSRLISAYHVYVLPKISSRNI